MPKALKIVFSKHTIYQLKERNIPIKEIRKYLKNPDKIIKQYSNRFRALKKLKILDKNYLLIIIFDKINSNIEIVTAFRTSKIRKYL